MCVRLAFGDRVERGHPRSRKRDVPFTHAVVQLTTAELLDSGLPRSHPCLNAPLGHPAH